MKRLFLLLLALGLSAQSAMAFEPFVVEDIRIDGLQRISDGTVFTYLTIEKGDRVDLARSKEAIRALFKTGFFNDIKVDRQGQILVITVVERPAISKITLAGNKDLKDEDLRRGLKEIGLSEGETFDRLQLDRITQELTRQYNNRGKYNVSIKPTVTDLDRNRVDISIIIKEGKAARIRHLNVVGNKIFTDDKIREEFESNTTNWLSWYSRDDQYSREKLSGDLEKLTSFYQDRGYVDFAIESTQVTVSPDRRDIYLTANVREGEVYTISEIKLTGDLIVSEANLRRLLRLKPGDTFDRGSLERSSEAMTKVLANIGYAFAEVSPIPDVNREKREVSVTMFANPGKRVYVRRVEFEGNARTHDEVMRRELRQFEGAWYSQAAVDRSKIRLQRLGFFKNVNIETPKVPGSDDQIDIMIKVEEQSSAAFQFGLGYSALAGLITSISVTDRNFLGTGNSLGVTASNNSFSRSFDFNYIDPYFTDNGLSLGYQLSQTRLNQGSANLAQYTADNSTGAVVVGIPFTEVDTVTMRLSISRNELTTVDGSTPPLIIDYLVDHLGDRARYPIFPANPTGDPPVPETNGGLRTWIVNTWKLEAGWARDTRNRFFAPTRGSYHRIATEVALPGSDLEYYKLFYQTSKYFPLGDRFTLLLSGDIGYGDGYNNTSGLPFFENFYAGGTRAVRGFEDNTLGPCYQAELGERRFCQSLGGAFRTVGSAEIIFPALFGKKSVSDSTQFSAFLDVGNVFSTLNDFDTGQLRAATGIALKWQAPVGPIVISLAFPLLKEDGDRTESFQFTFGSGY